MYNIGIDLGGTNIVAGVVDEHYRILAKEKVKTALPRPAEEIAADMAAAARRAAEKAGISFSEIACVGVGSPGAVDAQSGCVIYANNLGFRDVPLSDFLRARLDRPVRLANDANAAAFGEYLAGAGRGCKNFVMITLGTGVGNGLVLDGRLYTGSNGAGGETGHTVIDLDGEACTCGRRGCWEAYASATALIRQTRRAMREHTESKLWQQCGGDEAKVDGRTAFDAMRAGDEIAAAVCRQYIRYIAVGVINLVNIFQPEILCIGGGICAEGAGLTEPIAEMLGQEDYARALLQRTRVCTAQLGNDAGIIGAAFLQ